MIKQSMNTELETITCDVILCNETLCYRNYPNETSLSTIFSPHFFLSLDFFLFESFFAATTIVHESTLIEPPREHYKKCNSRFTKTTNSTEN